MLIKIVGGIILFLVILNGITFGLWRYERGKNASSRAKIEILDDEKDAWNEAYDRLYKAVKKHEQHCEGQPIVPDDDDDDGGRRIWPWLRDQGYTFDCCEEDHNE